MIDGTEKPKSLRSLQNAQRVTTNLAVNTYLPSPIMGLQE